MAKDLREEKGEDLRGGKVTAADVRGASAWSLFTC